MFSSLFLLFAFFNSSLCGCNLSDYFKPALEKQGDYSYGSINFVYMINLDERPEKYQSCIEQLRPHGIRPYRFSAVNGWTLPLDVITAVGVSFQPGMRGGMLGTYFNEKGRAKDEVIGKYGRTYFCHKMTKGAIGIVLSHLSVLQDAYDSGYKLIWVIEDDIVVANEPKQLLSIIKSLDQTVGTNGWDILFTDRDTKMNNGQFVPCCAAINRPNVPYISCMKNVALKYPKEGFVKITARFGAYSMIIKRSGMKKILDFFKQNKIFLPYDIDYLLPDNLMLFSTLEDFVVPKKNAPTDNGRPNYQKQ